MDSKEDPTQNKQDTDTTKNLASENAGKSTGDSGESPQNNEMLGVEIKKNIYFRDCSILAKKIPK